MKKPIRLITAGAAVVALSLSTVGVALAAPVAQPDPVTTQTQSSLSEAEIAQLAAELEVLFTRYVQLGANNQFAVNEPNLRADGYSVEQVQGLRSFAEGLNLGTSQNRDALSFAKCVVVDAVGLNMVGRLSKALVTAIRAAQWPLAAKTILQIGLSAGLHLGWKGNAVGLALALGKSVIYCRREL
ncbi:hypothetical protein HMPREF9278_1872 [Mobiluncus mulieris FB024-16]|uniref:hypothetical protein n=1 Tax=Mobiluncus mulieris TaxID=2052 RepID=UPI0001E51BC0|nr:hypothetical protein [Mobiluncus mulieris]EFN92279.1 hypothetical protein HMPREF9278_1872 [Mobiluncus mulieris FB024-16]